MAMMRTAERLAATAAGTGNSYSRAPIVALIIGEQRETVQWLEGQARLLLAAGPSAEIVVAPPTHAEPATVAETIRRLAPGFVIAQFGRAAVPSDDLRPLAAVLESPLFVLR